MAGDRAEPRQRALAQRRRPRRPPREYADLVAFLASPVAGYITGATLRIDGGWHDA
ncbi:SDR family oxidoreductase [Streptosporangium lutulentum]